MGKDGNTYQKVPSAWLAILETFTFSPYIQIIPRTEIKGMDATKLPIKGSFLETSETSTMISAETKSFTRYQIMTRSFDYQIFQLKIFDLIEWFA